ncbi:uncharacterized protein LOC135078310 [Ostrinia nubilalis]|uniref:uncharacterized protein LOC135078310 n=1 Tax=Ostrinia nubilalis TaxID=29057 RepID=UPI0030825D5E
MATTYPGVVSIIKRAFSRQSLSTRTSEIMISSLAPSSLKQYNCAYKKWWKFCKDHKLDLFCSNIPKILEFFTELYDSGSNYSTLNTTRSALAVILGKQFSQDDRILRFIKGVYRTKPCFPKYESTWDPNIVLNHLSQFFPNERQNLEILTKKLVTLLSLSTAQRTQTLSLIELSNVRTLESKIEILIDNLTKTSAPNRTIHPLVIPFFQQRPEICPGSTIVAYINATKEYRELTHTNKLILTIKKPYHNASSSTIGRWIKNVLSDSGVDTSIFGAHSTRHASTSAASRKGASIDSIKRAAGWTGNSLIFAKFYNRPIATDSATDFANVVFN